MIDNKTALLECPALYIVPTPIGNLGDITQRSLDILNQVDLIAAEDTRHSGRLLSHFGISTKTYALHDHNEQQKAQVLVDKVLAGESIALISDAGTPAISDPGFLLTRACVEHDIEVDCLPGATAFVPALVNSGLPNDKFVFEGFLPVKKGRQTRLKFLAEESRTIIFYESPHKLLKTLANFVEYFGADRPVSVSRELTKLYEETVRGSAEEVLKHFTEKPPKGEIVIVVGGKK